jgi:hypothetical protein
LWPCPAHQLGLFCCCPSYTFDPQAREAIDEFTGCLYLSSTNAFSFAASDVIPLIRWVKMMTRRQSAGIGCGRSARDRPAVNILG